MLLYVFFAPFLSLHILLAGLVQLVVFGCFEAVDRPGVVGCLEAFGCLGLVGCLEAFEIVGMEFGAGHFGLDFPVLSSTSSAAEVPGTAASTSVVVLRVAFVTLKKSLVHAPVVLF